jgi:hypothetical protein
MSRGRRDCYRVKSINLLAARPLDLWAFLNHSDVWAELELAGQGDGVQPNSSVDLGVGPVTKLSLQHSIGILVQYSLVNMSTASQPHSIHPVVHTWCLHNLGEPAVQTLLATVLRLVARMADSMGQKVAKERRL